MATTNLQQWFNQGERVTYKGNKIFLIDKGSGTTLLLIHGFPTSSWDWHKLFPTLTKHFRVLCLDMLGYGYSDKPENGNYTTHHQAEMIYELLKQRDIQELNIMAYSYGVSVVQEMLSMQLEHKVSFESLCFLNGGLFRESNHPKLSQRLMLSRYGKFVVKLFNKSTLARNLKAIFGPDTQPSNELINEYWTLLNTHQGKRILPKLIQYLKERQIHGERWEETLRQAICPMQLIVGAQDSISGIEVANQFRKTVSQDNIHILDNIGHYPQLEAPDDVLAFYLPFVQKYTHLPT
ncbi:alpha/beta hydrolase [Alteromonadaceae bacterium M269]|nr:alpha/beta hydrolase [Alteromonadaceae bacterium M269]